MTQQRVSPISVTSVLPAVPVLSLQAALGQSANLTEWKNSSGTVITSINSSGVLSGSSISLSPTNTQGLTINRSNNGLMIAGDVAGVRFWDLTHNSLIFQSANATLAAGYFEFVSRTNPYISNQDIAGSWAIVNRTNVANVPFVIRGMASQSGDLQQWQNSAGTVLAWIGSSGVIASDSFVKVANTGTYLTWSASNLRAIGRSSGAVVYTIVGSSGQTANLQEWQNSAGTVLANITSGGNLGLASGNFIGIGASTSIGSASASFGVSLVGETVGVEIGTSRTGNGTTFIDLGSDATYTDYSLRIIRNSGANGSSQIIHRGTGALAFSANEAASITFATSNTNRVTIDSGGLVAIGATPTASQQFGVVAGAASTVGVVVKGAASQTANLQEWQNSAGTILAGVQANGQVFGTLKTNNAYVFIQEQNSGGSTVYTRQTATPAAPGANAANLYFRDGTNAGTLKLVVRAGTGGAETTILDNIPTT